MGRVRNIKRFIKLYLPFAPLFEEFANKVECRQKELEEGNSINGYRTSLGELMESFKEKFQEHFYWFPRLMRWKTSQGDERRGRKGTRTIVFKLYFIYFFWTQK